MDQAEVRGRAMAEWIEQRSGVEPLLSRSGRGRG